MQDIRDAFRSLRSTPVVTTVAMLSLALGIGANTAIFSILNALMLRALPVEAPQQLALIGQEENDFSSWTYPLWEQFRAYSDRFAGAFAWSNARFNTASGGEAKVVEGFWVSGEFFGVLGVRPVLGRAIAAADDVPGGGPDGAVAVISYNFWQKQFGGAADAVGKTIVLDRVPHTIVGVAPPGFNGAEVGDAFDVAVPFGSEPLIRGRESILKERSHWWLNAMVRLHPGQTLEAGTQALRGVQPQIREATMPDRMRAQDRHRYLSEPFVLRPGFAGPSYLRNRYQRPLTTMMGVVSLVLLIACANIANLLLARASARRHEMSVRLALGASRLRLARQLLTESLLLSAGGALLGLEFARWGSALLVHQFSTSTNQIVLDLSLDWRVLAFTTGTAVATAVLFGTAPAWRAARAEPNEALKEQGRGVLGEGRVSVASLLVVAQVALSLVLVLAAGLFVRTFTKLATMDAGFERDPVLIVNVDTLATGVAEENRPALFERLRQAAVSVPGVNSAAISAVTPVSGMSWQFLIDLPDKPEVAERDRIAYVNIVSPDFFRTLGTRLLAGRDFTQGDRRGAAPVAIVNETFAKKFFDGRPPIGQVVRQPAYPKRPAEQRDVVGYVQDAVYRSLRSPVPPTMYLPAAQHAESPQSMFLTVRASSGSPSSLIRGLAAALTGVDRNVTLTFRPLAEQVRNSLVQERLIAMISGFFGALALLLAGIGLYGVTSYAVTRRRAEIGIRMALGAAPSRVVTMVLRRVTGLVAAGVIAGIAIAAWAGRFVATLLYGVEPRDVSLIAAAALILALTAALSAWLPARRAARIDPATVLREG